MPPLSGSPQQILDEVAPLTNMVAAINVTDGAGARTTMSSLTASAILARAGIEPVLQLTCRDRNRISLTADLIGASALGIHNLLPLSGDDPSHGDQPDAKVVNDLDTIGLITMASKLSERGLTPSDRAIEPAPHIFVGAADVPHTKPEIAERLKAKVDAGARFVQTQLCYDINLARQYMEILGEAGVLERASVLIGLGPIASAKSALWMRKNLWGVAIPDNILQRLDAAQDQKSEGKKICMELIQSLAEIEGVSGVHVMAPGQDCHAISDLLSELQL